MFFCQCLQCCITADRMGGNLKPDLNPLITDLSPPGWDLCMHAANMLLTWSLFFFFVTGKQQWGWLSSAGSHLNQMGVRIIMTKYVRVIHDKTRHTYIGMINFRTVHGWFVCLFCACGFPVSIIFWISWPHVLSGRHERHLRSQIQGGVNRKRSRHTSCHLPTVSMVWQRLTQRPKVIN